MPGRKSREEIAKLYQVVSSKDGLLYHIAHGRRENSGVEYSGEKLCAISASRAPIDVHKLKEAASMFRGKSMQRN